MKKLLVLSAAAMMMFLSACSDEDTAGSGDLLEELDITSEATLESNYEDVDLVIEAGMEAIEVGGRVATDDVLDCATVTHDAEAKTVVIDYGDGCEGPGGRVRAGIIRIAYNDHRTVPGSYREATFDGFSVDGVLIEGVRRVENTSDSLDDYLVFNIQLTNGQLTFEDGTTATRTTNRTRTWIRANNPQEDEAHLDGNAEGVRRDGVAYSMEILETLVYKRSCRSAGVFIPVSGVKQFTSGDNVAVVDFGDGSCDNMVMITINGGEPITKVITPRGIRK